MKVFDWYVFRNLAAATIFVALTLAVVIFLTQSLRFLELVVNSGASSVSFWILTFLALPRFFEVILPLALMAATIFIFNRMTMDSELVVVRAVGYSPINLAKPALLLSLIVTVFLWSITMWVAPKALANMHQMRQVIKAQFSNFLFQEGVFNRVGSGLTVYIRERSSDGELRGLMIHDSREKTRNPSSIIAKRGVIVMGENGQQVVVYDGSRQEFDKTSNVLQRLNFERYTIDLPDSDPIAQRWSQPDERTVFELLDPDMDSARDVESLRDFRVDLHRRIIGPLLAVVFTLISCCSLLLGPVDRRGQGKKIALAIGSIVIIQGLFLATFNMARHTDFGIILAYILVFLPFGFTVFLLSGLGDHFRRRFFYRERPMP